MLFIITCNSRTILDNSRAELLKGQGDMLLSTGTELIHLQGAFVDTTEVERLSQFIGLQRGYSEAFMLPRYGISNSPTFAPEDVDSLFEDAARLIVRYQQGSTSLIQRKLKLGYNRAGQIMDQLEAAGIVGPFEGSKAREVNFANDHSLDLFLNNLKPTKFSPIIPKLVKIEPMKIETNPANSRPTLSNESELNRKNFWEWLFK